MTFLKDNYDISHGTAQIIFTTLKTQSFKCYRISNSIINQFLDSKDIKKFGFAIENEEDKNQDDESDEYKDEEIISICSKLWEKYNDEIKLKRLQKFSVKSFLYKVKIPSAELETKICIDDISNLNDFRVEFKQNLSEKFEYILQKKINDTIIIDLYQFFDYVVLTMKSESIDVINYGDQGTSKSIFSDVLGAMENPADIKVRNDMQIKETFIPSPRVSGICWSPHGYLLHFKSSLAFSDNIKGVMISNSDELNRFYTEWKTNSKTKEKLNSEQKKMKKNILTSLSRSNSSSSNSSNEDKNGQKINKPKSKPFVFNSNNQELTYNVNSPSLEESFRKYANKRSDAVFNNDFMNFKFDPRGLNNFNLVWNVNKNNDVYGLKNVLSMFSLNTNISYSYARGSVVIADTIQDLWNLNHEVSTSLKRSDFAKMWKLISISLNKEIETNKVWLKLWKSHPTGWLLIKSLFNELRKRGDWQNISMIGLCLFLINEKILSTSLKEGTVIHLIPPEDTGYWKLIAKSMNIYSHILSQ